MLGQETCFVCWKNSEVVIAGTEQVMKRVGINQLWRAGERGGIQNC